MHTLPIIRGDIFIDSRGHFLVRVGQAKAAQDVEEVLATSVRLKDMIGQSFGQNTDVVSRIANRVQEALGELMAHQEANSGNLSKGEKILSIVNLSVRRTTPTSLMIYFNVVTDDGTIEKSLKFTTSGFLSA